MVYVAVTYLPNTLMDTSINLGHNRNGPDSEGGPNEQC